MTARASDGLWRALEAVLGLAAVEAEWDHASGGAFEQVRAFLRPRAGRAESFPGPGGGLPYEVRDHGGGEFVGVCLESGRTVPLTAAQLVVYELDRRRLADALAGALGIDRAGAESGAGPVTELGRFASAADTRYGCFLAVPNESADVQVVATRLIAEGGAPFLLFAPTRRWLRRATETVMKFHGCAFVALAEVLAPDGPGRWRAVHPLDALLARTTGVASVAAAGGADAGRNVFRRAGDVWELVFAGQKVGLTDSLGVRCLAHLLASKRRDVDAAALKAAATGNRPVRPLGGFEGLDREAWEQYRAHAEDLVTQLEEATRFGDGARQERLQQQIAALAGELGAARGLGGRPRQKGDQAASVRTSVKNAVSRTLALLEQKHPALARHLDTCVTTGATLRYDPVPDVEWEL